MSSKAEALRDADQAVGVIDEQSRPDSAWFADPLVTPGGMLRSKFRLLVPRLVRLNGADSKFDRMGFRDRLDVVSSPRSNRGEDRGQVARHG